MTSDTAIADKIRALRTYGWHDQRRVSREAGWNSRLDELQAAILNALLPDLEQGNAERGALARVYLDGLNANLPAGSVGLPASHPGSVYHQFAIAVANRDLVRERLAKIAGIGTGIHYAPALHQQPAFAAFAPDPLPVTERLAERFISLPIQPEVVQNQASKVVDAVAKAIRACNPS